MLQLADVEEIRDHLLRLPAIVDQQAEQDRSLPEVVEQWLRYAEELLSKSRSSSAASVASIRSSLLSVSNRGPVAAEGPRRRSAARKASIEAAAEALRRGEAVLSSAVSSAQDRLGTASDLMLTIVAAGAVRGIPAPPADLRSRGGWLTAVWQMLAAHEETREMAGQLLGLAGPRDALVLLDRTLSRVMSPAAAPWES